MKIISKASAFPKSVQPGIPVLGCTPSGWQRGPLSDHLFEQNRPIRMTDDAKYDLVTVKRSRGGVVTRERLKGKDISVKSQSKLKAGDFLISKRQIVHGACGIIPSELDGSIASNEYAVLGGKSTIDLNFLNYLSHSIYFQQTCFHSSTGVHVEKMIFKLDRWLSWNFNLPPLPEQQKIAEILSTWDRAIGVQERLIANARAQKKALIRNLFSSKRGIGVSRGSWKEAILSEVANVIVSNVDKKSVEYEQPVKLCNYMDVYRSDQIVANMPFMKATATEAQIKKFALTVGDVLITKDSETPDDIAIPSYVSSTSADLICGYHLAIVRPTEETDGRFLKYFFEHDETRNFFSSRANGATRFGLTIDAIENAPIKFPELAEQKLIGEMIRTAEKEIQNEENLCGIFRQEKSALMQQLLTGKRRVQIKETA